jgi:signal transduction histidine kinase
MGNAELLTELLNDDEQLRSLAEATRIAAERGAELTGRLRAFSSGQSLRPQRTDLNRLLGTLDGVVRRVVGTGIEVEHRRGADLWEVMVDPSHFENALLNLCLNACDAMPHGGHLRIETANVELCPSAFSDRSRTGSGRQVLLTISDNGGGMTREVASRVFEPYFTTKGVGKGNGLGLSMVFGFVKQSRGRIELQSEPGQGTQVKIYLPALPRAPEAA